MEPTKTVIIAYDLKDVCEGDNERVKEAFQSTTNALSEILGICVLGQNFGQWVLLELPATTMLATVKSTATAKEITLEVAKLIRKNGATPGKICVAQINISDSFVLNA